MSAWRIVAIIMALVMIVGGTFVSLMWLLLEGTLLVPLASGTLAALGMSVVILELQEHASTRPT